MSLRRSPTLTPALLAANRNSAKKSTSPHTARGKAASCFNGLRAPVMSAVAASLVIPQGQEPKKEFIRDQSRNVIENKGQA